MDRYAAPVDLLLAVEEIRKIGDDGARLERLEGFWSGLAAAGDVPFIREGEVLFLYRGEAEMIRWYGDWNGWGREGEAACDPCRGRRVEGTDLWMLAASFPSDARLDYKIVRNGGEWMLDAANPRRQKGGFGPNSELRMPEYAPSPWTDRREGTARGGLSPVKTVESGRLGYAVNYRVYTPRGHDRNETIPVVYVTDGHEYAADDMGSMVIVLDNLIAAGKMIPAAAVFLDPREVGRPSNNRRSAELVGNRAYVDFVADELAPQLEEEYGVGGRREDRAILGTSLGGLNAAYFGAVRPESFGKLAIQSPAFGVRPEIYDLYRSMERKDFTIFMSNGRLGDGNDANDFAALLEERGFDFRFIEVNEGHSWGQWRALLDEALVCLFPPSRDAGD